MKTIIRLIILVAFVSSCSIETKSPLDYVDPFIGTDAGGHTFPGACLPFGMVQLSPDNGYQGVKAYSYDQETILGFSHTHLSGTGPYTKTHYNNVLIMPRVGDLEVLPGVAKELNSLAKDKLQERLGKLSDEEGQKQQDSILNEEKLKIIDDNNMDEDGYYRTYAFKGYESTYSHQEEEASPGYYAVNLKDYGIKAELTVSEHAGFHRYTFPESDNAHIVIDVTHSLTPGRDTYVKVLNERQIEGKVTGDMEGSYDLPLTCYFFAEFSKSFVSVGTWNGEDMYKDLSEISGKDGVGAFVNFATSEGEQVLIRVGISFVSIEGAKKNLRAELRHWDFDKVVEQAREVWNKKLNKIEITGGTEKQKTVFYTAMYHSHMFPRLFSDVDGSYYSHFDDSVYVRPNERYYVDFSLWDTYRAQHPLLAYTEPERQNEMIRTFLSMYDQGGRLPLHVSYKNHYQAVMIGDHATSVIVDSYMKGIRDYDIEKAYEAMRKNAMVPGERPSSRYGLDYYMDLQYIPAEKVRESVSVTLEDAYDDWCLAEMARTLGKDEDYALFSRRARYYENLYDKQTGFMRPRKLDGSWLEMCLEYPEIIYTDIHPYYSCFDPLWVGVSPNRHFTESSAWQYLWHIQHDVQGLINLMGGRLNFVSKLDTLFAMTPHESGSLQYAPLRSKIGQYVHGNEPVHHVAYLYNYAGEPWKTQKWVNEIRNKMYGVGPDGLCGNDDMGQMSAWYIFSAMGFYPVAPGQNIFAIGTPLFEEATLKLGEWFNNKEFTIKAEGVSSENVYIQSANLNGEPYELSWIKHDDIIEGGILVFKMGPVPNKKWGTSPNVIPPSMSSME
ncbi:MAG: GH92 family glycosyl hydrolase [Bacteroidota bacterium]|nr:GH92 family glycosyl hydrolase [Bacteroidota bacterium]